MLNEIANYAIKRLFAKLAIILFAVIVSAVIIKTVWRDKLRNEIEVHYGVTVCHPDAFVHAE